MGHSSDPGDGELHFPNDLNAKKKGGGEGKEERATDWRPSSGTHLGITLVMFTENRINKSILSEQTYQRPVQETLTSRISTIWPFCVITIFLGGLLPLHFQECNSRHPSEVTQRLNLNLSGFFSSVMFLWESSILKDTLKRDICYIMQIFIEKLQSVFFLYKAGVFRIISLSRLIQS